MTVKQKNCDVNGATCIGERINFYTNCGTFSEKNVKFYANSNSDETIFGKKNKQSNTDKNENEQEIVFIQDITFPIIIHAPGIEPFEIQVSCMEVVQEIHQILMEKEETCHRTCFSLQFNGKFLDFSTELKKIEGLKEKSIIKVIEEPYTVREARIHVKHIRNILKSLDPSDAYNGLNCNSLSFQSMIIQGDILEKRKNRQESIDCTPPDYIMPGIKEIPLTPLHPQLKDNRAIICLKIFTISGWNPPPGIRKIHGDLLYLYVVTLEDKCFHITCCQKGFYINQSTHEEFDPKPVAPFHVCHSIVDLLSFISSSFKKNFSLLLRKRSQKNIYEKFETPYQIYTWVGPQVEHTVDAIRAEETLSLKLGYEEHIPGHSRDWNDELQNAREMPRKSLPDRLIRERVFFKIHSDFVAAATRAAVAVVEGSIMALNPEEDPKNRIFLWNNIFFSFGFDIKDHYKAVGGDAAAQVAPVMYHSVDVEGLYTVGTAIIDYRGFRVTAQTIIPGILEKEQGESVVYGSLDFGGKILSHPKYHELLSKAAIPLKILPHYVLDDKEQKVELFSSVECKGIIGNEGRHYILDLIRTFPPDVNFLKSCLNNDELSEETKKLGFPVDHPHKLCCLRQELINSFVEYMLFIKCAAFHLQQLGLSSKAVLHSNENSSVVNTSETMTENESNVNKTENIQTKLQNTPLLLTSKLWELEELKDDRKQEVFDSNNEAIKKALQAVGSLKQNEFFIAFNPDVYTDTVQHPDPNGSELKNQRQLVKEAADFLLTVQIPEFIQDASEHIITPCDGVTLTEILHGRGINIRYLGKIIDLLANVPHLVYLSTICASELISRSAKHIFCKYMQSVEMCYLAVSVSHFLNCLLCSHQLSEPFTLFEEDNKTVKKKYKKRKPSLLNHDRYDWAQLQPHTLWMQIKEDMKNHWNWETDCKTNEMAFKSFGIQKISLLRSFCLKTGIQILLKDYNFDSTSIIFYEDDIVNLFPICSHINPKATDGYYFYSSGQLKIQQGYLKEGYELISEALNLLTNVYGAMHPDIVDCLRTLARLNYWMGDQTEALSFQQKAVLMSERVNGIDHPSTVTEYIHLALYCFANNQISIALKLLYRSRYLSLLVHGEIHPEIALLDTNIGLILHAVNEFDLSLRFLEKALELNIIFYGECHLKVAVSFHLVARTQSCLSDFRTALQNEKEAYQIYKKLLGEQHEKTKESSSCLLHLTQQAVLLQKKMNEIYTGKKGVAFPPVHVEPPPFASVLEMLSIINGIVLIRSVEQSVNEKGPPYVS